MDDVVALRVRLTNGEDRFFLTWGRVFGAVDGGVLIEKVEPHLAHASLGGEVESVEVCDSLQAAAKARYFFEGLFAMSQKRIPFGANYDSWSAEIRSRIEEGREIYYLGETVS